MPDKARPQETSLSLFWPPKVGGAPPPSYAYDLLSSTRCPLSPLLQTNLVRKNLPLLEHLFSPYQMAQDHMHDQFTWLSKCSAPIHQTTSNAPQSSAGPVPVQS
jgi:hypothetical protein